MTVHTGVSAQADRGPTTQAAGNLTSHLVVIARIACNKLDTGLQCYVISATGHAQHVCIHIKSVRSQMSIVAHQWTQSLHIAVITNPLPQLSACETYVCYMI